MNFREINIKENMPSSDYAIHLMIEEIDIAKFLKIPVVVIIHGYGSHGKGGVIARRVQRELNTLKHDGKIVDWVYGSKWSDQKEVCKRIVELCPNVEIAHDLHLKNSGVSVILVSN